MRPRLSHILHAVYCEPWLIRPEMHAKIREIVEDHLTGAAHAPDGRATVFGVEADEEQRPILRMVDRVAVISVEGVLGKRIGMLERISGGVDVDDVSAALRTAMSASMIEVSGIVLDINSPGGTVTGIPELASEIKAMRDQHKKRIVGFTDTMAASAAYWMASQASCVIASPSACVGSIGVYMYILDQSRRYEEAGVKPEVIKAGTYKGAGLPGVSLTDAQRQMFQDKVDYLHQQFKAAVRAGRGVSIDDTVMEGQDFFGAQAVQYRLVDMIGNMSDAIQLAAKGEKA